MAAPDAQTEFMSTELARFDPAMAARFVFSRGHPGWLGLHYTAHGENWVELTLPWREDLAGETGRGVLASGTIISLLDMACGMAIWTTTGEFRAAATLDLRVDYMRPAREGTAVHGRAECYRVTRSAAFLRGMAHDGDPADPVAHVAAVFMFIPGRTR